MNVPCVVLEIPVPSLKNMTQWLDVFPTESVRLSCNMREGSDWKYTWERNGEKINHNDVTLDPSAATLTISSASAKHKGQYKCKGHLEGRLVQSSSSAPLILKVYGEFSLKYSSKYLLYIYVTFRNVFAYEVWLNILGGQAKVLE